MQDAFKNGLIQYGLEHNYIERSRIRKDTTPIIFTCSTKFGYSLIESNKKEFRYDSDRRFTFMNDEEFLKEIENEILEELWEISQ